MVIDKYEAQFFKNEVDHATSTLELALKQSYLLGNCFISPFVKSPYNLAYRITGERLLRGMDGTGNRDWSEDPEAQRLESFVKEFNLLRSVSEMVFGLEFTSRLAMYTPEDRDVQDNIHKAEQRYPVGRSLDILDNIYPSKILNKVKLQKNRLGIYVPKEISDLGWAYSILLANSFVSNKDILMNLDFIQSFKYTQ